VLTPYWPLDILCTRHTFRGAAQAASHAGGAVERSICHLLATAWPIAGLRRPVVATIRSPTSA
jgi:hypothetical protein